MRVGSIREERDNAEYADMENCFLSYLKDQADNSVYEAIQKEDRIVEIVCPPFSSHLQLFGLSDRISELGGRAQKKQENLARSSATIRFCRSVPSCRCRTCCLRPRRCSSPR